jgi:uncharacterized protein
VARPRTLSPELARRFLLAHQGLWPPRSLSGEAGVLRFLRRVRSIQYDPLDIVGHNPELVLQSRVEGFRPETLETLLYGKRLLVDYWDKQMGIWPVEDWPLFRRRREAFRGRLAGESGPSRLYPEVRRAIETRGPLSSIDLESGETIRWPWGPARIARAALEGMFWQGDLVVHHRVHTRKVYDLAERHIPARFLDAPDPCGSEEEYSERLVLRRLRGIGLLWTRSSEAWLEIPGVKGAQRAAILSRLLDRGEVDEYRVEGLEVPLYAAAADAAALRRAREAVPPRAAVIAPLDNLLWDRGLIRALFGFDYVWEVYKPVPQRKFGYYVLPVLYGDRFVARFEPGRDQRTGEPTVKRWWWEEGVERSAELEAALRACFRSFAAYLGAPKIRFGTKARREAGWCP